MVTYQPETGSPTSVPAPPGTAPYLIAHHIDPGYQLQGLLVPDGSPTGYTTFSATLGPDFNFSVPNVPSGSYFLTLTHDCGLSKCVEMTELTANSPDLSMMWPCRPDFAYPTQATNLTLELSGMQPWSDRDWIEFNSSQACLSHAFAWLTPPRPPLGATSFAASTPWYDTLPDAAKGDVVFVSQKSVVTLGDGNATYLVASRAARVTGFSLADGGTASLTTTLSPQLTGTFRLDLRWSQFAALAADVYPTAIPGPAFSDVVAIPLGARDFSNEALLARATMAHAAKDDVDYGTLLYGQFLDPNWRELGRYVYVVGAENIAVPESRPTSRTVFMDGRAFSSAGLATAPVVSPPKAPQINGMDAFVQRAGVGLQPVLSWSKPAIGTPTSYWVEIEELVFLQPDELPPLLVRTYLKATVRSGTSFKVPPDFLKSGRPYIATITAVVAKGDTGDRLQFETDWSSAACFTAGFSP